MTARISEEPLDLAAAVDAVSGHGGASCVFAGTVRRENRGREVVSLRYEAHRPLGERVLRELEEQAGARDAVRGCRIAHRVGTLDVGEVSVVVAVAADSRDEALRAARRAMDELKERVPMWKEERYADGETRFLDGSPLHAAEEGERPRERGGADGADRDGAPGGPGGGRVDGSDRGST